MSHITVNNQTAIATQSPVLQSAIDLVMSGLSQSSKRVYMHTYDKWMQFCQCENISPLEITHQNVSSFLSSFDGTKSTKQRRLSALRRLLDTLAIVDYENPQWEAMHKALQRFKVTAADSTGKTRDKQALKPRDIYAAFDVWQGDKLVNIRNRALLAVAFYAGLRRSEIAALKWSNIDFDNGMVLVEHGKGDKERTVPFVNDEALTYIEAWRKASTAEFSQRTYIFCGLRNRGSGELLADKPMSTTAIYKVMQKSGGFAPHDARRTLITDMLNNGVSVADAQFVAGHANPQTTLGYAQVKDAKEVKGRIKVSY